MARSFAGADNVAIASNLGITGYPVTLSCWVYLSGGTTDQNIFDIAQTAGLFWFRMEYRPDQTPKFLVFDCTQTATVTQNTGTNATLNTWTNVVGTCTSTQIFLYVNGTSFGPANNTGNTFVQTLDNTSMGEIKTGGLGFVNPINSGSRIADAAVWNVALTASEALSLSQGARPYTIRPSALVGYWPLDGLQSPEPDLSGKARNGTLTATALAPGPPTMMFTPRWPQFWFPPPSGGLFLPTEPLTGMRVGGPFFGNPIG